MYVHVKKSILSLHRQQNLTAIYVYFKGKPLQRGNKAKKKHDNVVTISLYDWRIDITLTSVTPRANHN